MRQLLELFNPHWDNQKLAPNAIARDKILSKLTAQLENEQIVFVTGLRRVGKTTLLKMLIDYLVYKKETDPRRIFYVSLDHYLLSDYNLFEIIEQYRTIHGLSNYDFVYLFFDEITYMKDYQQQLKNIFDLGNVKIFASSSSASLMKSKKPYLTGRSVVIEVSPLDFDEYLQFKGIKIRRADEHLKKYHFHNYLQTGGIPQYVLTGNIDYLQNLVDDILYKDIIGYYGLKNTALVKDFFLLLMERDGKLISINKISKILKISTETASRFLSYFQEVYLVYLVLRYGKTSTKIVSPRKIYASDLGIRTLFTGSRDFGSLFENYVFLKIKHLEPYYVSENGVEIDFYLPSADVLIEAKYHDEPLNEQQKKVFETFNARNKIIVRNHNDIENVINKL